MSSLLTKRSEYSKPSALPLHPHTSTYITMAPDIYSAWYLEQRHHFSYRDQNASHPTSFQASPLHILPVGNMQTIYACFLCIWSCVLHRDELICLGEEPCCRCLLSCPCITDWNPLHKILQLSLRTSVILSWTHQLVFFVKVIHDQVFHNL